MEEEEVEMCRCVTRKTWNINSTPCARLMKLIEDNINSFLDLNNALFLQYYFYDKKLSRIIRIVRKTVVYSYSKFCL